MRLPVPGPTSSTMSDVLRLALSTIPCATLSRSGSVELHSSQFDVDSQRVAQDMLSKPRSTAPQRIGISTSSAHGGTRSTHSKIWLPVFLAPPSSCLPPSFPFEGAVAWLRVIRSDVARGMAVGASGEAGEVEEGNEYELVWERRCVSWARGCEPAPYSRCYCLCRRGAVGCPVVVVVVRKKPRDFGNQKILEAGRKSSAKSERG